MKTVISLIRHLKKHLPLDKPVIVRRKKLKGVCGWHYDDGKVHRIEIEVRMSAAMQIETLTHEFAHALDNSECREPHRDTWGKWYSRVYREQLIWENY